MASATKGPVVDVHSHLYPPSYIELLRNRTEIPCIRTFPPNDQLRLVNRAGQAGKPMTPLFYDVSTKIAFMDAHGIDISILSIGNPWLDFMDPETAGSVALKTNDEMNDICGSVPRRLFFFAALPLTAPVEAIKAEIQRVKALQYCRGVVMGTNGFGKGLDDPNFVPVYEAIADSSLPIFLHPNYGLPPSVWGPCCEESGQVLPVSLGFTMETTIAITRMFVSDVFIKVPKLQMILSHAGGALPFLGGRIESCIKHDRKWEAEQRLTAERETIWDVLKNNIYLDGIIYTKLGISAAVEASGIDRVLFGTDHPFFPPLDGGIMWPSMTDNKDAVEETFGDSPEYQMIMGGNAVNAFKLKS